MHLFIDASNLRLGGGITHIREMLAAGDPTSHGFDLVTLWAGETTLKRLPDRPWLDKREHPWIERGAVARQLWQRFVFPQLAEKIAPDVVWAPGGSYFGKYKPAVTMGRNLLPFEPTEVARYRGTVKGLRLKLLAASQKSSFRRSQGVIFLTGESRDRILAQMEDVICPIGVIPHGVAERFFHEPRVTRALQDCTEEAPFRLLYVSHINQYKNPWHVAEAVALLRAKGFPVVIDFVGPAPHPASWRRFEETKQSLDPSGEFLRYLGEIPYAELERIYGEADLFVFASNCETFGNIVLEAMASGLPIACTNRRAVPEVLGDAGCYFNPEDPQDIARCIGAMMNDAPLRAELAAKAFARAKTFSWERCARETFDFLAECAKAEGSERRAGDGGPR